MRSIKLFLTAVIAGSLCITGVSAGDKEFDSEKILSDLEYNLELTNEQLARLKPAIDEKSSDLKKSMHESIDKGFVQWDKLSAKFDKVSKDAEKKAGEILNSEEMTKLKDYLNKIDKKAVKEMKDRAVADLSAALELTEEQLVKLKPIFEDSYIQLGEILAGLAKEGNKSWEGFKQQYGQLSKDLKGKLQDTLDNNQMKKLEKYNEEKKVKIQEELYSV